MLHQSGDNVILQQHISNGFGWTQGRVKQFFSQEELLTKGFLIYICKSENGYNIVIDEYKKKTETEK